MTRRKRHNDDTVLQVLYDELRKFEELTKPTSVTRGGVAIGRLSLEASVVYMAVENALQRLARGATVP